jgi:RNA-directed DNA polymerase
MPVEGRDLSSRTTSEAARIGRLVMNLIPAPKIQKLRAALHAKAKGAPSYRFYALYDKVYRLDVLGFAYECCRVNNGAPGVDGQTFDDIEAYGFERWLGELAASQRSVIAWCRWLWR